MAARPGTWCQTHVHYLDEIQPLLGDWDTATVRAFEDGYTTHWWRAQCDFRGVESHGTLEEVKARLISLTNDAKEASLLSLHGELKKRQWHEAAFQAKLQRVLPDGAAPLTIKVHAGTRLAVLRACAAIGIAPKSVEPLAEYQDRERWVVVGTNQRAVREKAAEIEHRISACEEERIVQAISNLGAKRADALARLDEEEQDLRREALELGLHREESDQEDDQERADGRLADDGFADVLARLSDASLDDVQSIKDNYLMYSGQVLDPDVDVWIPDNPESKDVGLIASGNSDRLKAYWIAQCHFRGIFVETKDSILSLQAKLRDRDEVVETRIEPLKDLCDQVLDAEFRLENPQVRFNVRAVRKGRAIMLQPERNSIARGQWSARNIRGEVRDALFQRETHY